jgi:hypothetical protein
MSLTEVSQEGKKYDIELSKGVVGATEKGFKEYGTGYLFPENERNHFITRNDL